MAHRNQNLVPKGVVNRLGHATTVYTRPTAMPSERPGLRAAAVPRPAAPPTEDTPAMRRPGTPLPPVTERSDEEITAFLDSSSTPLPYLVARPRRDRFLQAPERDGVLLAMDLVNSGKLPLDTALHSLDASSLTDVATSAALASDRLRVAARLQPSGMDDDWLRRLGDAAAGNLFRTHEQITPEEDLDSAAAVIEYVMAASHRDGDDRVQRAQRPILPGGKPVSTEVVPNLHLDELLRERPADLHRIMEYVQERGMHPSDPRPVADLRAWLGSTEDAPAVGEGWL